MDIKKRLVTFGDSWVQGSELAPKEKTFGQLLSEYLECDEYSNRGHPASNINHLIIQLNSHLLRVSAIKQDLSEWMAVFFLTDPGRGMSFRDNQWIFFNARGGFGNNIDKNFVSNANTAYWKYIYSSELSEATLNITILALQSMCKYHGITDYYLAGWQKFDFWTEVDTTRIYHNGQISCGDLIGLEPGDPYTHKNPNVLPGGHPSQKGHQIIADALYQWISRSGPLAH